MYIESIKLNNFRKFREEKNEILLAYEVFDDQENTSEDPEVNISQTSTLIIGKNNVGKTSVIRAIKKLAGKDRFVANDFNFYYLQQFLNDYNESSDNEDLEVPKMKFTLKLRIKSEESKLMNIAPVLFLDNPNLAIVNVEIVVKEEQELLKRMKDIEDGDMNRKIKNLLTIVDDIGLVRKYYTDDGNEVEDFQLRNLIEMKPIEANKIAKENSLNEAFNKIIKYRYNQEKEKVQQDIDKILSEMNEKLTSNFEKDHQDNVNKSLKEIEHPETLSIDLSSDLTFEKILHSDLLLYEYKENDLTIPEDQYGLGYTNLVMIIAEIIEYIEKSPEDAFSSKINIISIEEPETYMHPQMQELFIKNIDAAIKQLLDSHEKYVNSQIIITTHSSHILNSKIHSGDSFDHINYLTEVQGYPQIVKLSDENIISDKIKSEFRDDNEENKYKALEFLKKHITFKVSELFYSDAAIFVEGITEKTILREYIDQNDRLRKFYISIFNIDGAHGLVYHNLIQKLRVPTIVITDLDIKKTKVEDDEKDSDNLLSQVSSLENKVTTNRTLMHYMGSDNLKNIKEDGFRRGNLYVIYQMEENGYFPTSFEEALILANYDKKILQNALKKTRPRIYKDVLNDNVENLKNQSRYLQHKLNNAKSEFSNRLLMQITLQSNGEFPLRMPKYIKMGLDWLVKKLVGDEE